MIVQCPSCASRYRIRDANIPPTGGKIRCPSCSHGFIVYPESDGGEEESDKTSITSKGEISNLVNQMAGQKSGPSPEDEDYVATQIAAGEDLDKMRAMQALQNELGDPMDMDGTVEIKNPMDVWKEAQAALQQKRGAAPPDDPTGDGYEHAATEVVNPSNINLPFHHAGPKTIPLPGVTEKHGAIGREESDPTFQMNQDDIRALDPQHPHNQTQGDSSPGVDPSGMGSGVHPYAQNTPPSGQQPSHQQGQGQQPEMVAQRPGSGSFDSPRQQSPSGLQADDLFAGEDLPETVSDSSANPTPPPGPGPGQAPPQQDPGGGATADPNHPGPWKLKTNFGLTYEFPDTRGLRSWLSNREELDGYTVSADGDNFFALGEFPQLDKSSGRHPMPSGNFSVPASHGSGLNQQPPGIGAQQEPSSPGVQRPGQGPTDPFQSGLNRTQPPGPNPTTKGPIVNTDFAPPSNKKYGTLWLVFFLLLLVAVAIGLQTFGVYDVKGTFEELILGKKSEPATVVQPTTTADEPAEVGEEVDPAELEKKQAAEVAALLEDAERLIESNKLQSALEKLQTTVTVAPENPRVHEMMADVHERLGQADEAEKASKKAEELRNAGANEPGEEDSEAGKDGEGEPAEGEEKAGGDKGEADKNAD